MDFRPMRNEHEEESLRRDEYNRAPSRSINLAPLKGALESDPVRSKILRILIEDGSWVTTADLLRVARQVRSVVGAVTIGTILIGLNDLVSSRLILSRTSMSSGIDWAEWRINPDWLEPTRKLLRMLNRVRRPTHEQRIYDDVQRLLEKDPDDRTRY
ncbi:MAG: hypothetical protein KAQ65_08700 [Candidatus Thorarchaeota archaeon]|nr:hypothetical protein [Candidatus Thorarchaeota archaeon]